MCTSASGGREGGGGDGVSAEWRQEPRRHVTDAPPLRSPCRRGFAPRQAASRHSALAALRRIDDDSRQARRQGWRAERSWRWFRLQSSAYCMARPGVPAIHIVRLPAGTATSRRSTIGESSLLLACCRSREILPSSSLSSVWGPSYEIRREFFIHRDHAR